MAYYTACANIETTHEKLTGERVPFTHGSYVDTFTVPADWREQRMTGRAHEQAKIDDPRFRQVRSMRDRQRDAHIHVIMTNPPYSAGQKSANEDNKNVRHPEIEGRVKETYIKMAPKGNVVSLYNSYIKALRWASDRIGESGIIGLIIPSAWITGNAEAGIRACIYEEFAGVWCFDLRGNAKAQGEQRRREAGNVFGGGSREATAIVILVKNSAKTGCTIHYHDVGDYLSREQKFGEVMEMGNISNVSWEIIRPDKHHDWLDQRGQEDESWQKFLPIGSKDGKRGRTDHVLFRQYSNGLKTHRDMWVYNTSRTRLTENMKRHIDYCNEQDPDNFQINVKQAKWNAELATELKKLSKHGASPALDELCVRDALFRPFFKQRLYFDPVFVAATYQIPKFFPRGNIRNPTILVPDKAGGEFSTIITDNTPDLNNIAPNQAFPLKAKKQSRENVRQVAPPASSLQPPASSLQPPASSLQPPASSLQPPASSLQPPASSLQPPASSLQPPASSLQPPASSLQPPASSLQPPASSLQPPASENLAIIVPDKIKGEFSVFITNMTPDLHVLETSQVFPMKVTEK